MRLLVPNLENWIACAILACDHALLPLPNLFSGSLSSQRSKEAKKKNAWSQVSAIRSKLIPDQYTKNAFVVICSRFLEVFYSLQEIFK